MRRNAIVYWFGEMGVRGVQFLLLPVLGRLLTPAAYGAYAVLGAIISGTVAVGTLGMEAAAGRFIPRAVAEQRNRLAGAGILVAAAVSLVAGWLVFLVMLRSSEFAEIAQSAGALFPLATSLAAAGMVAMSALRSTGRSFAHSGIVFLRVLILASGVAVALLSGLRDTDLAIQPLIWSWIVFGVAAGLVVLRPPFPNFETFAQMLAYGVPLVPHVAAHFVMAVSDRIVLQAGAPGVAVGQYSFAYQLSTVLLLVAVAMNNAWAPRFMAMSEGEDEQRSRDYSRKFLTVVAVSAVLLAGWGPATIRVLADSGYWAGGVILPTLVLAFVFNAVYLLAVNPLLKGPNSRLVSRVTTIWAVFNVVFNVAMVPRWGMWAPAVSTLLTYAGMSANTFLVQRKTIVGYVDVGLTLVVVAAVAMAVGMLSALPIIMQVVVTPVLAALLVAALLRTGALKAGEFRSLLLGGRSR